MNEDKTKASSNTKKAYESPKIKRLGKLSTLIQGISGRTRDAFPMEGVRL